MWKDMEKMELFVLYVCMANEKSIICLPCKHFFCGPCLAKVIDKTLCPICRAEIKITFDFNLKKENLIKSILSRPELND